MFVMSILGWSEKNASKDNAFPFRLGLAAKMNIGLALSFLGALVLIFEYRGEGWAITTMHSSIFLSSACVMGSSVRALMSRPNAHLQILVFAIFFYGNYIYQGMCLTEVVQSLARLKLVFLALAPGILLIAFNLWSVLNASTRNYFDSRRYA